MKKITLILLLFSAFSYSQNYSAYKEAQPITTDFGENLNQAAKAYAYNKQLSTARRAKTHERFNLSKSNAFNAYRSKDYNKCIYYYESSNDLGWYDAAFEYIAGVSYFEVYQELDKKKYKKKAKKLLKKSKKHGYIDAEIFLDKNF